MKTRKIEVMRFFSAVLLFALLVNAPFADARSKKPKIKKLGKRAGITCWREIRKSPRKLSIYVLEVDLTNKKLEVVACVTKDPDRDGPADATLALPANLVKAEKVVAAVNTNAFSVVGEKRAPTTRQGKLDRYKDGMPSAISGWVISEGAVRSTGAGAVTLCVMKDGTVKITSEVEPADVKEAVAGFAQILDDGEVVVEDKVLHPRTGIGVDKDGEKMWLVVVDGRQRGYSQGVTTTELAEIMLKLGAWDAINVDGGGSSIMFFAKSRRAKQINKTPYGIIRPIPVMIGVREIKKKRRK